MRPLPILACLLLAAGTPAGEPESLALALPSQVWCSELPTIEFTLGNVSDEPVHLELLEAAADAEVPLRWRGPSDLQVLPVSEQGAVREPPIVGGVVGACEAQGDARCRFEQGEVVLRPGAEQRWYLPLRGFPARPGQIEVRLRIAPRVRPGPGAPGSHAAVSLATRRLLAPGGNGCWSVEPP